MRGEVMGLGFPDLLLRSTPTVNASTHVPRRTRRREIQPTDCDGLSITQPLDFSRRKKDHIPLAEQKLARHQPMTEKGHKSIEIE
jgi:hypothetical protein